MQCQNIIDFVDRRVFVCACRQATTGNRIFRPGTHPALDTLLDEYDDLTRSFVDVQTFLCVQIKKSEIDKSLVKLVDSEKRGFSFVVTKRRMEILQTAMKTDRNAKGNVVVIVDLWMKDLEFLPSSSSSPATYEISSPEIRRQSQRILELRELIAVETADTMKQMTKDLETQCFLDIAVAAETMGSVDVLLNKAYLSKKFGYCRPRLVLPTAASPRPSFVDVHGLRHALIEHISHEIYVPNDVFVDGTGMLIYGVNTTGKTSLIRALGIAVVLAQCGWYVPATSFRFRPYRSIFTRILSNDNLFQGMSTFAVEMSELRVILQMADEFSLVLGDELCSGTENESALSIFVAGLMHLFKRRSSFLFATHFHEILRYDEIVEALAAKGDGDGDGKEERKPLLQVKHMAVTYNTASNVLVYDRKLAEGPGYRMYGIEICKSLHLPESFLEECYLLRNKYNKDSRGALSYKESRYNSQKIRGRCERCRATMATETHHLHHQSGADRETGMMTTMDDAAFHKNHVGNLAALCESCHRFMHSRTRETGP
jgi:DNA mismatch repair protein MutS